MLGVKTPSTGSSNGFKANLWCRSMSSMSNPQGFNRSKSKTSICEVRCRTYTASYQQWRKIVDRLSAWWNNSTNVAINMSSKSLISRQLIIGNSKSLVSLWTNEIKLIGSVPSSNNWMASFNCETKTWTISEETKSQRTLSGRNFLPGQARLVDKLKN